MFYKTSRRLAEDSFKTSELSWSLDFELDLIQQNRIAHLKRIGAKAQRLAHVNGVEPSNVSKTLDELVRLGAKVRRLEHLNGVEPSNVSKTLDELVRLGAKVRRLEHLNGVEPSNVSKSLDELVLMRSAQLDAELAHMQEMRRVKTNIQRAIRISKIFAGPTPAMVRMAARMHWLSEYDCTSAQFLPG